MRWEARISVVVWSLATAWFISVEWYCPAFVMGAMTLALNSGFPRIEKYL